jgi:hypothetical protein
MVSTMASLLVRSTCRDRQIAGLGNGFDLDETVSQLIPILPLDVTTCQADLVAASPPGPQGLLNRSTAPGIALFIDGAVAESGNTFGA